MVTEGGRPIPDAQAPVGPLRRRSYGLPQRGTRTFPPAPQWDFDCIALRIRERLKHERSRCFLALDIGKGFDLCEDKVAVRRFSSGSRVRCFARSCQDGKSSNEFALTSFVVAAAILAGVLGGIWVAEREGLIKQQASALKEAAGSPVEQPQVAGSEQLEQAVPSATANADKTEKVIPLAELMPPGLGSIRAIHFSSQPDLARVEIEVENMVLVRAARLHNPERVYADLQDSRRPPGPAGRMQANKTVSIGNDLIAGIRVAQWESGAVRIVLDLNRPCEFSHRLTPEPSPRLIVEVRPDAAAVAAPGESARSGAH